MPSCCLSAYCTRWLKPSSVFEDYIKLNFNEQENCAATANEISYDILEKIKTMVTVCIEVLGKKGLVLMGVYIKDYGSNKKEYFELAVKFLRLLLGKEPDENLTINDWYLVLRARGFLVDKTENGLILSDNSKLPNDAIMLAKILREVGAGYLKGNKIELSDSKTRECKIICVNPSE